MNIVNMKKRRITKLESEKILTACRYVNGEIRGEFGNRSRFSCIAISKAGGSLALRILYSIFYSLDRDASVNGLADSDGHNFSDQMTNQRLLMLLWFRELGGRL